MAPRTKKKAVAKSDDTITFKKSELLERLKDFLTAQDACEGDWVNKVRVEFLGEKELTVTVKAQFTLEMDVEMTSGGVPSATEVKAQIVHDLEQGNITVDIDEFTPFEVLEVKKQKDE